MVLEIRQPEAVPELRAPWPHKPRTEVAASLRDALLELRAGQRAALTMSAWQQAVEGAERSMAWAVADLIALDCDTWERVVAELEGAGRPPAPTVAQPEPVTRPVRVRPGAA